MSGSTPLRRPGGARRARRTARVLLLAARVAVPAAVLVVLVERFGGASLRPALAVVSPAPLLAALALGAVAVAAQAARWRTVAAGAGLRVGRRRALAECYRSAVLNAVLPGGVGGDVVRAWRSRVGTGRGWQRSAGAVLAERASGTAVLLAAATLVLVGPRPPAALLAAGAAVAAWAVTRPWLRVLSKRDRLAVWGHSAVALAALLALVVVTARAVGTPGGPAVALALGVALLAGMSVPVNLGGWGPREAAGALGAAAAGLPASDGLALAAGYGLLATVSVLPGVVVLVLSGSRGAVRRPAAGDPDALDAGGAYGHAGRDRRRRGLDALPAHRREVELDADVRRPSPKRRDGARSASAEPVLPVEPQPGDAVADQQRRRRDEQPVEGAGRDEARDGHAAALDEHPAEAALGQCRQHVARVEPPSAPTGSAHHLDVGATGLGQRAPSARRPARSCGASASVSTWASRGARARGVEHHPHRRGAGDRAHREPAVVGGRPCRRRPRRRRPARAAGAGARGPRSPVTKHGVAGAGGDEAVEALAELREHQRGPATDQRRRSARPARRAAGTVAREQLGPAPSSGWPARVVPHPLLLGAQVALVLRAGLHAAARSAPRLACPWRAARSP